MAEAEVKDPPVASKSRKKQLLGIVITLVLVIAAGVAGTLFGPRVFPGHGETSDSDESAEAAKEPEAAEDSPLNPFTFQPLIVDVKDKKGQFHHIKVGLSVEASIKVKKEEFDRLSPRGREATIGYLRAKTFEELTEAAQFESIMRDLNERVIKAMGEKNVRRVVITDFVAQ
jgi:flagellar basal body-associated protein FliL